MTDQAIENVQTYLRLSCQAGNPLAEVTNRFFDPATGKGHAITSGDLARVLEMARVGDTIMHMHVREDD